MSRRKRFFRRRGSARGRKPTLAHTLAPKAARDRPGLRCRLLGPLRRTALTRIRHHVRARAADVTALAPAITPTPTSTPRMPDGTLDDPCGHDKRCLWQRVRSPDWPGFAAGINVLGAPVFTGSGPGRDPECGQFRAGHGRPRSRRIRLHLRNQSDLRHPVRPKFSDHPGRHKVLVNHVAAPIDGVAHRARSVVRSRCTLPTTARRRTRYFKFLEVPPSPDIFNSYTAIRAVSNTWTQRRRCP